MQIMLDNRQVIAWTALLAGSWLFFANRGQAEPGAEAITCTNASSGASWQIRIDYVRRTVDAYPARITESKISWHDDQEGSNYTLDRRSGELTAVVPSSTGGYFLHHRCGAERPR
jgi:hypothetical protein